MKCAYCEAPRCAARSSIHGIAVIPPGQCAICSKSFCKRHHGFTRDAHKYGLAAYCTRCARYHNDNLEENALKCERMLPCIGWLLFSWCCRCDKTKMLHEDDETDQANKKDK